MSNEQELCPLCGEGTVHQIVYDKVFEYKGQSITLAGYTALRCDVCGEELTGPRDNPELERKALEFRRQVDGLLSPEEIKSLRLHFGYTQEQFSELLGMGKKTFARYENGSVQPSKSMNLLLRALQLRPHLLSLLTPHPGGPEPAPPGRAWTMHHKVAAQGAATPDTSTLLTGGWDKERGRSCRTFSDPSQPQLVQ
jgi:HTH-type transcriptional regulator/antitoxin MqsA